ncbi:aspartyl-trna synthetase [Diaporthe eres]|uniref:aspartate--tRNA ligase n=2 Tax=Diaporthe vaccinii TaxID=105482 RepID=A0ABR4DSY7_9PEZI|nr:aspartyl-trna synthetase [Diaporthe eres]
MSVSYREATETREKAANSHREFCGTPGNQGKMSCFSADKTKEQDDSTTTATKSSTKGNSATKNTNNTTTTNNNQASTTSSPSCLSKKMTALQNAFRALSPRSSADHGARTNGFGHTNGHERSSSSGSDKSLGKASRRTEDRNARKETKALRLQAEREEIEERRKLEDQLAMQEEDEETRARYGWVMEAKELLTIREVTELSEGAEVTFRARIHHQRNVSKHLDFLLFRDQTHSIQGVLQHDTSHFVKWVQRLEPESLVQVTGTLQAPPEPVRSATHKDLEVKIYSVHVVNAAHDLPFDNYEPPETTQARLSNRILDLRHPSNQALFRIRAMVTRKFRDVLDRDGFIEIQTPKLQPAATESGAEVFKVNYFGRRAFLAQSPQLAKQMTVSADFGKVYEIGPVFRAENSNTKRHLAEYTGLDIEMAIQKDYYEVIREVDSFLKEVFRTLQSMPELEIVRQRWPSEDLIWLEETPIIPFTEGLQMLRDDGIDVEEEDLSTRNEIRLGELVKEKYKTDYYVLDKFPANARPFYTHKDATDPKWTNSFDMFIRGQEICSGGQRIHDAARLRENMRQIGMSEDGMEHYLAAFDLGAPPHAGAGLGLERILAWTLQLVDVRYATLYHRDPKSMPERNIRLAHPDCDTKHVKLEGAEYPLEKLIANYGDATNTSWLDDRFEIWRHPTTGAAVGYVRKDNKFAMVTGDPLCDPSQSAEVAKAFVKFVEKDLKLTPIWMLVSESVQDVLGRSLGWRTLTCVEEQRVDADKHAAGPQGREARKVEREGIDIDELRPDEDFMRRTDAAIEQWMEKRKGKKQVHLTEIRPWVDTEHRRYFAAQKDVVEDGKKVKKVMAVVILAQLAPRHGWQVKWALDFPGTPSGVIEATIQTALAALNGPVTFGAGVSDKLLPGAHLGGVRAKFLAKTYDTIIKSLRLNKKSEFREKFGAYGEPVYICYPRMGLGVRDFKHIIQFFED